MRLVDKEIGASYIYIYILTATILTSLSFVSFLFLASSSTSASDHVSNVSVTVPVSCNISSTLDTAHTATINPGQYKEDIGTTTFKVFCNDNTGYAIYAIGYSGDEYGNTNMLPTNPTTSTNPSIVTGTATSGDTSNWAMKVTPVAGTYAPTIENSFNSYRTIPDTYTKVASLNTNTDFTIGSSFQSTYRVFVSQTQPADTYTGKVKYTIVHPNDADPPLQPHAATPKCISYWPNASGVVDSMGDQCSFGNNATVGALWASNFRRDGYGFAGWSDKFDWVLNENDVNGDGTGPNEGYHIYGPNQNIITPSDMTEKGLSLYAVWVPAKDTLQNWNGCSSLNIGEVTALKDARDHNAYAVAKLADGKCWMIENLRLDNTAALTTANTNNPAISRLSAFTNPTTTAWCNDDDSVACIDQSMLYTGNTTNPATNMSKDTGQNIYSYGNYYNWYSATAGRGTYSKSSGNAEGDICPTDWHLPTGNEFGVSNSVSANGKLVKYPNNFIYFKFGTVIQGIIVYSNARHGYYWSSSPLKTIQNDAMSLQIFFNSNFPHSMVDRRKYYSAAVRCTLGS
ncbi:hypothetical protein IKF34_02270 [Candidatus Saccharibacteria bacterium]|nr:hypothetical protein [Candidatus Saccharibacteria bacterium]